MLAPFLSPWTPRSRDRRAIKQKITVSINRNIPGLNKTHSVYEVSVMDLTGKKEGWKEDKK